MASSLEEYMAQKYSGEEKRKKREKQKQIKKSIQDDDETRENSLDIDSNSKRQKVENSSGYWKNLETMEKVEISDKPLLTKSNDPVKSASQEAGKIGGLQTTQQIAEDVKKKEDKLKREMNDLKKLGGLAHKTVYRDLSGRKLTDSEMKDLMQKDQDSNHETKLEREKRIAELNRDENGIIKEQKMKERLQQIHNEGINIYENDKTLIDTQKSDIKSEDPALLFNKNIIEKHKEELDKQFVSPAGRKLYKNVSGYPLNRFGIKPGWRWDGIVRGNGFEQKWHDAQLGRKK